MDLESGENVVAQLGWLKVQHDALCPVAVRGNMARIVTFLPCKRHPLPMPVCMYELAQQRQLSEDSGPTGSASSSFNKKSDLCWLVSGLVFCRRASAPTTKGHSVMPGTQHSQRLGQARNRLSSAHAVRGTLVVATACTLERRLD